MVIAKESGVSGAMVAARVREHYDKAAKERQKVRKGDQPGATVENLPQLDSSKARDAAGKVVGVSGKTVDYESKCQLPINLCQISRFCQTGSHQTPRNERKRVEPTPNTWRIEHDK